MFSNTDENNVKTPISFQNTITNIQGQLSENSLVDITPLEVFELIESYLKKFQNYLTVNLLNCLIFCITFT